MIESLADININLFGGFTFKIMVHKFTQSTLLIILNEV